MAYISQLMTMVDPTKMAKQKAPKRIIILGCARCVMPKTIEVKSEKSRTALKWVSMGLFSADYADAFLPLASEWASTAAIRLSRPPTTRNLVP